jgi:hypothetical protein
VTRPVRLKLARWAALTALLLAPALAVVLMRGGEVQGEYTQVDGPGKMVFRGERVYITTALGITFASRYELDGNRVIIRGAAGSQVFTRDGGTLDAGLGIRYVKTIERGSPIDE